MNDLNIALLKQHIAILQTHLRSINTVAESMATDAALLEAEMSMDTPAAAEALAAYEEAQGRARMVEAKLAGAIKDLHFVMAGGDPCKVCAKTCKMGEPCQPVWKQEGCQ